MRLNSINSKYKKNKWVIYAAGDFNWLKRFVSLLCELVL